MSDTASSRTVSVRRFDPDSDAGPHWQSFQVPAGPDVRVLDLLHYIKDHLDPTLTFRRSCGQGSCGDDAMRINGANRLACTTMAADLPAVIVLEPIKGLPVERDLVVDMRPFFQAWRKVGPVLAATSATSSTERSQSPQQRERFAATASCILCAACTTACPVFWTDEHYLGPAAIVAAHRFIFDSRDEATEQRLDALGDRDGAWRCRTSFNCTQACPKHIEVTGAIAQVKRAMVAHRM